MNPLPSFREFFTALWGENKTPFPWQEMLAERVAAGVWPDAIDLPTASGKTACLDIAVYALAAQADKSHDKRTASRRIWFVVDRRIVVDEAFERAKKLAEALENPTHAALQAVAERLLHLRGLDSKKRPLAVGRLRGGVLRDDGWARIPSQAAILTSTVDQLGSRLLFRGYGHSALAAPIFAGLVGNDSLILLDEAHCAVPFLQTLHAVKLFRSAKWSQEPNPTPFHVAVLSATPPDENDGEKLEAFPATDDERTQALNHTVLQARLTATKRTVLELVKDDEKLTEKIVAVADGLARKGTLRIGVIVNRVARAMEIAAALQAKAREKIPADKLPAFDVELLTGRIRPVERDALVNGKLHPFLHSTPERNPERPLILVSTQCLEVGADFSFDALVTECASLDALRQRFGRLARLGKPENTEAFIFAAEGALKEPDPIYGEALKTTWDFLWNKAEVTQRPSGKKSMEERSVNFGFEALRALLPLSDSDELRAMLAPAPDAPILLPAHLDLLCQTAPLPHPDPDVGIFLHGKGRTAAEVRVGFRCDLDPARSRDWPEIASLCPPVAGEMLSVPLYRFRGWLADHASADHSGDVAKDPDNAQTDPAKSSRSPQFLICRGRNKSEVSTNPNGIFPDDVILLPAPKDPAGLDMVRKLGQVLGREGFGDQQIDVWELARIQTGKTSALRLNRSVLAPWLAGRSPLSALLALLENNEPSRAELDEAIATVLAWQPDAGEEAALPNWLRKIFTATQDYYVRDIAQHPGGGIILYAKQTSTGADVPDFFADDDDDRSKAPATVLLAAHCAQVGKVADRLARACLGEDAHTVAQVAGLWHDAGKLDPRFQSLLRGGDAGGDGELLAKSPDKPRSREQSQAIREAAGLPDRFRHEMFSLQLAERCCAANLSPEDRELLLHLIASHHGHARPFAPVCEDERAPKVEGRFDWGEAALSEEDRRKLTPAHRLDSGVVDRFWRLTRRYGWWGLAYREAILRLADWQASEHPEVTPRGTEP